MKIIIFAQPVTAFTATVMDDVADTEPVRTVNFWASELVPILHSLLKEYSEVNQIILHGNSQFTDHFVGLIQIFGVPVVQYDPSKDV